MSEPRKRGGERISIVLADDHAVVRGALRALLESRDDFEVVGEAADIASTRATVRELRPQVLILDVKMPDGFGVDAVAGLREEVPETEIVILTMQRDMAAARSAIEAGARSYLFKEAAHLELVEAVHRAVQGNDYLPGPLAAGVGGDESDDGGRAGLSSREIDVLRLMVLGHTNREIGEQLAISIRTVETHRAHIQQKLGLERRPELMRYALERGLIDT